MDRENTIERSEGIRRRDEIRLRWRGVEIEMERGNEMETERGIRTRLTYGMRSRWSE